MIYLADIRNWLKGFNIADYYYSGKLDANKEKAICVYQRKSTIEAIRAIGGKSNYNIKPISVLIHWNKNSTETEKTAYKLYEQLEAVSSFLLNDTKVYFIRLLQSEPVSVGTDDNGIYEYVIEFDIYYERK